MAEREFLLKFLGDASGATKATSAIDKALGGHLGTITKVAAGAAALGVGLEALARSQAENTQATRRLSEMTGMQEGEVRKLAKELSNVTFPLKDVLGLMELGTKQGLEGADALSRYANFWDLVADATGMSSTALAESTVALRAVGVDTANLEESLAALGFVQTQTTAGIEGFFGLLERKGPALKDMNFDINDAAALLGVLEEQGLSGRAALSEFEKAVNSSDGSLEVMLATLGVTSADFARMRGRVDESSGALDRLAEANNSTFTPMQKLKHMLDEQVFAHGELIGKLAMLTPGLVALGPILGGVIGSVKALSTAMLFLSANPIGLVIIGVAALVAGAILIWQNWDKIKEKGAQLGSWLMDKFGPQIMWLKERYIDPLVAAVQAAISLFEKALSLGSAVGGAVGRVGGFLGFDSGGVVPGPVGAPQLAVVHGGETILPTHKGAVGGTTFNVNITTLDGPGARDALADLLLDLQRTGRIGAVTL